MSDIKELRAQLGNLKDLLEEAKLREKQEAIARFKEDVELYEITEEELMCALGFRATKKQRAPAKFYDPSTGLKWSGYGRRPKWLVDKNLDDFLIRGAAKPWWPGEK